MTVKAEQAIMVEGSFADVFDACLAALDTCGAKILATYPDRGEIRAEFGVSWRSWGDNITIWVTTGEESPRSVTVKSESKLRTTLIDYGKGTENVTNVVSTIVARLQSEESQISINPITEEGGISKMICPKCGTDVPTGSTSCPNCGAEFVFVPQPVTAPSQPVPQPTYARPLKDRSVALILEILPGLFGFLGFGWIYAGNTNTGVAILASYFVAEVIFVILDVASGGLCCFVTLPIAIVAIALSASKLNTYTKTRTDLFGA